MFLSGQTVHTYGFTNHPKKAVSICNSGPSGATVSSLGDGSQKRVFWSCQCAPLEELLSLLCTGRRAGLTNTSRLEEPDRLTAKAGCRPAELGDLRQILSPARAPLPEEN